MKLREFFYFPKSDRIAILALVIVAIASLLILGGIGRSNSVTSLTDADSLTAEQPRYHSRNYSPRERVYHYGEYAQRAAERFPFDPNTADSTQFLRLGLRPWMVKNIYKYRSRGGIFRRAEDFSKVYGLTVGEFEELLPYIRIDRKFESAASLYPAESLSSADSVARPRKLKANESISLNDADTTELRRVPGIGPYYARQIVNYRTRLGGFVAIEQLLEIEDFPQEALEYFKITPPKIQKLNVNRLTLNQLKRHPYISFYQAKAITDYRRLHGPLQSLDDLRLLNDFTAEAIERLAPYVEF